MGVKALELAPVPPLFIYGTLCHSPLLHAVAGCRPRVEPARASGFRVFRVAGRVFPAIAASAGDTADGLLITDLDEAARDRIDAYEYEAVYRYRRHPVTVTCRGQEIAAETYLPEGAREDGGPWNLQDWTRAHGTATVMAATEWGRELDGPEDTRGNFTQMLVRAHSHLRAGNSPMPARVRRGPGRDAVNILHDRLPYRDFFSVREQDLTFHRFDGSDSPKVRRAAFQGGDAVAVLPYDPVRDRVLVVEQFRYGPYMRGDALPWALEPPAGRIDPGESPQDAARRELVEESGIAARELLPVASYYPSPGAWTEYIYTFVALCDLPDDAAGPGGLDHEEEDIWNHVLPFDQALDMLNTGEADCAPLVITLLWLAGRRETLRPA